MVWRALGATAIRIKTPWVTQPSRLAMATIIRYREDIVRTPVTVPLKADLVLRQIKERHTLPRSALLSGGIPGVASAVEGEPAAAAAWKDGLKTTCTASSLTNANLGLFPQRDWSEGWVLSLSRLGHFGGSQVECAPGGREPASARRHPFVMFGLNGQGCAFRKHLTSDYRSIF